MAASSRTFATVTKPSRLKRSKSSCVREIIRVEVLSGCTERRNAGKGENNAEPSKRRNMLAENEPHQDDREHPCRGSGDDCQFRLRRMPREIEHRQGKHVEAAHQSQKGKATERKLSGIMG